LLCCPKQAILIGDLPPQSLRSAIMLAFAPIARTTFDMQLAQANAALAQQTLQAAFADLRVVPTLITDSETLAQAIAQLRAAPLSLIVVFQATFADSSAIVALAEALRAPLLLWAAPEPATGGRLRSNALCGINLAAFALKRRGLPYLCCYAAPDSPEAVRLVQRAAAAAETLFALRHAKIGVIGEHPTGFEPCAYDAERLRARFGVQVQPYALEAAFAAADSLLAAERVTARYADLAAKLSNLTELNTAQVRGTLSFHEALRDQIAADDLRGVAIRCWPETFLKRDCAVCAASSLLCDDGIPATCEADVHGVLSGLLLQGVGAAATFGADLVAADLANDTLTFWHCGLAPLSMCAPSFAPRGALHSNRQRPLLMEFPLKAGRVTLARLTQAGASGDYRLLLGTGEMLDAPMQFSGTSGVLRPDSGAAHALQVILQEGLDHHFTLAYGDFADALTLLADFAKLPIIRL
jgi:L-fucose isomerase-like protein